MPMPPKKLSQDEQKDAIALLRREMKVIDSFSTLDRQKWAIKYFHELFGEDNLEEANYKFSLGNVYRFSIDFWEIEQSPEPSVIANLYLNETNFIQQHNFPAYLKWFFIKELLNSINEVNGLFNVNNSDFKTICFKELHLLKMTCDYLPTEEKDSSNKAEATKTVLERIYKCPLICRESKKTLMHRIANEQKITDEYAKELLKMIPTTDPFKLRRNMRYSDLVAEYLLLYKKFELPTIASFQNDLIDGVKVQTKKCIRLPNRDARVLRVLAIRRLPEGFTDKELELKMESLKSELRDIFCEKTSQIKE